MKTEIHPTVNPVIFVDRSSGAEFLSSSTLSSEETRDVDGVTHHVIYLDISSASHPFYTGRKTLVDTAGRIEKFKRKLEKAKAAQEALKAKSKSDDKAAAAA